MSQFKKFILIPTLIISLAAFTLPTLLVLAEEGEGESQPTEEPPVEEPPVEEPPTEEPPVEEITTEETGSQEELNTTEETNSTETTEEDTTTIETGDAVGVIDVENEVNTSVTDLGDTEEPEADSLTTDEEQTTQEETAEEPAQEEPTDDQSTDQSSGGGSGEEELTQESCPESGCYQQEEEIPVTIENESEAEIGNDLDGEAATGENSASNNSGDSIIETGDATIVSNVSNVANTNIVGSNFWFYLFNIFYNFIGNIYLNDFSPSQSNDCGLVDCVDPLSVTNNSMGTLVNDIELYALTGLNTADENAGDASIDTGNALAIANVSNLLNTNIIGSDWFFSIINSFGNWQGDLILPSGDTIEEMLGGNNSAGNDVYVANNSEAVVEDNVNVEASTGDNTATDNAGGSEINTGDAYAGASISTTANTSIFGSNWLLIGVKVLGNWEGTVRGVPDGVSWLRTPDGLILFNDNWANALDASGQSSGDGASLEVFNNTFGTIINNLNLTAGTGDNSASNNEGMGSINTGDAAAQANVANFVNTNIIGRNWLFAMFNIFGNWTGNLAFGQPDLWAALSAIASPSPPYPGGLIHYTLSYANNGTSRATDVVLIVDYGDSPLCQGCLTLSDPGTGDGSVPGQITWQIDSVEAGETGTLSYTLGINPSVSHGEWSLLNIANITALEEDANDQDNTDTLALLLNYVSRATPTVGPSEGTAGSDAPMLKVTKTNDVEGTIYSDEVINYQVVLNNDGDTSAYGVVVTDDFTYNGSSEVLKTNAWELGQVYPGEEIIIDYELIINGGAPAGFYTNDVQAVGYDIYDEEVSSNVASTTVELLVRGESTGEEYEGFEEEGFLTDEELGLIPLEEPQEEIASQVRRIVEKVVGSFAPVEAADTCGAECNEEQEQVLKVEDNGGVNKSLLAGMANLLFNGYTPYVVYAFLSLIILAILVLLYLRHRNHAK